MKLLSTVKTYGIAIVAACISVLLAVVTILTKKNSRLQRRVETADARLKHAKAVIREDAKTDEQIDTRLVDAANEIRDNGVSSELEDPTNWIWEDDEGER